MLNLSDFFTSSFALAVLYHSEMKNKDALNWVKGPESKALYKDSPTYRAAVMAMGQGFDAFDSALQDLGAEIKRVTPILARSGNITVSRLDELKAFGLWMRTGSEAALRKIVQLSANHPMRWIPAFFAKDVGSQKTYIKEIEKLVQKKFGGERRSDMTLEEAQQLRDESPEEYKEYRKLRTAINNTWKDAVSTFVRQSGQYTVPIKDVLKFLESQNLQHAWPAGFTGNVGADGSWYTSGGKRINGIPSPTMFPKVEMKDENGDGAVFVAMTPAGTPGNYFYTVEYKKAKATKKFEAVQDLIGKIGTMRKAWGRFILQFDPNDPKCLASLLLELSYQFTSRIGSPANKSTRGLSTIIMSNVLKRADGGYRIRYNGKDDVLTTHEMRPPTQGSIVERALTKAFAELLLEDKAKDDYVFSIKASNGKYRVLQPAIVNNQFRAFGAPQGVGVHKIRTLRGTKFMQDELEELFLKKKEFKDVKEFEATIDKLAKSVGKMLNHVRRTKDGGDQVTGTTALANYIDPSVLENAYEHYRIPIPRWLEKELVKAKLTTAIENTELRAEERRMAIKTVAHKELDQEYGSSLKIFVREN